MGDSSSMSSRTSGAGPSLETGNCGVSEASLTGCTASAAFPFSSFSFAFFLILAISIQTKFPRRVLYQRSAYGGHLPRKSVKESRCGDAVYNPRDAVGKPVKNRKCFVGEQHIIPARHLQAVLHISHYLALDEWSEMEKKPYPLSQGKIRLMVEP